MRSLSVKSDHNYQVLVGVNGLESIKEICNDHNKVLLIAPTSIIKLFKLKDGMNLTIFSSPDGENQKTVITLERIWKKCAAIGLGRQDAIVGFGGGATTDLAGFAAATWLRGITWYAIPTSLAGMVDASVGGKTGTANRYDEATGGYSGYTSSFIGMAPAEKPALVMSVSIHNPKTSTYGSVVAGPVFKKVMTYALAHKKVPPSTTKPPKLPVEW